MECTDSDCRFRDFAWDWFSMCKFIYYLVRQCEEQLNANLTSQEYTITSSNDVHRCSYIIMTQPGSGVEGTITDGTSSGVGCGAVTVLFNGSK